MPLIMHRTRNKGVVGVKGQYTKGPFYSAKVVTRQGKEKRDGRKATPACN
jgi:hypothetical protein